MRLRLLFLWELPASSRRWCRTKARATYEGWCRKAEAKLSWANHVDFMLQRGPRLQPGAFGAWDDLRSGAELQIFDARTSGPDLAALSSGKDRRSG